MYHLNKVSIQPSQFLGAVWKRDCCLQVTMDFFRMKTMFGVKKIVNIFHFHAIGESHNVFGGLIVYIMQI